MINNLDELEKTAERNTSLSFEEYSEIREPAVNIVINDYAVKLMEKAKESGNELTLEEARVIAKREIPATFVPEWMKNLRINANMAGTELCYLEAIKSSLERLEELLYVAFEEKISDYAIRHAGDFRREGMTNDAE